jgi:hypothetical protein
MAVVPAAMRTCSTQRNLCDLLQEPPVSDYRRLEQALNEPENPNNFEKE